jgi:hypothetical protein
MNTPRQLTDDVINSFVYSLSEYLNRVLPPEKHMGSYFDTDDRYEPLREFVMSALESYSNGYVNYN